MEEWKQRIRCLKCGEIICRDQLSITSRVPPNCRVRGIISEDFFSS